MSAAPFAADDWGLSRGVNDAILALAEAGVVRSVSLLANAPHLEHRLGDLRRSGARLSAHVNFTLGAPLSGDARALCDRSGRFLPFRDFLARGLAGRIPAETLAREAERQVRHLLARGLCLEALDGHEHVHALPFTAGPLSRLALRLGLRRVRRMADWSHPASALAARCFLDPCLRGQAGLEPEHTAYLWPTGGLGPEAILAKVRRYRGLPLLIHPSTRDDFGAYSDSLRSRRVREFEALRAAARGILEREPSSPCADGDRA